MTILLHNLLARSPKLNDAGAVTKLLIACDIAEDGVSHYTEEELLTHWQRPSFNLATDGWIVSTNKGQLVGYASLWHREHVHIDMQASVHPDYRGRGIGTLLLRLVEVRARQHIKHAPLGVRVALHNVVNNANRLATNLLEHEGYALVSHFWRILIEAEETLDAFQRQSKLKVALNIPYPSTPGTIRTYEPSGLYTVRQYAVYEKELRAGIELDQDEKLDASLVVV